MLTLKPTGLGQPDDYEALDGDRRPIGQILWTHAAARDTPWFWSITVRMPGHANAHVKATTSNAMVKSDFVLTGVTEARPKKVDSMIGGGGPVLDLSTSNGAIHIQKM